MNQSDGGYYRWDWFQFRQYFFTMVFTDIQGSTRLWERFGGRFKGLLDIHHSLIRGIIKQHNGCESQIMRKCCQSVSCHHIARACIHFNNEQTATILHSLLD